MTDLRPSPSPNTTHRYTIDLDVDAFVALLESRSDVRVLRGRPERCPPGERADYLAWHAGTRILVTRDVAGPLAAIWPPVLQLDFDGHEPDTSLTLRSRLTLGTAADAVSQSAQVVGSASAFVAWVFAGSLGVLFGSGLVVGTAAAILRSVGFDAAAAVAFPVFLAAILIGWIWLGRSVRRARLLHPVAKTRERYDADMRALAGELITPHVVGDELVAYRRGTSGS